MIRSAVYVKICEVSDRDANFLAVGSPHSCYCVSSDSVFT